MSAALTSHDVLPPHYAGLQRIGDASLVHSSTGVIKSGARDMKYGGINPIAKFVLVVINRFRRGDQLSC